MIKTIAITGPSGGGKTTALEQICKDVTLVTVISQDWFYKGLNGQDPEEYNFDDPNAIDIPLFIECITKLKQGKSCCVPTYDFKTHSRLKEEKLIQPQNIIIVEGIHVLYNDELKKLFDIKVYVDATEGTCIWRRLKRDKLLRGRTDESIEKQYKKFVGPAFHQYIEPRKKEVDIIIHNNDDNNFIGIKIFCEYLKSISK